MQAIRGANARARDRVNRRAMRRNGQKSMRAAIADVHEDVIELPMVRECRALVVALALIPLCVISTVSLLTMGTSSEGAEIWYELFENQRISLFCHWDGTDCWMVLYGVAGGCFSLHVCVGT